MRAGAEGSGGKDADMDTEGTEGKEANMETVNIDGGKESRMETVNIDGGKESRMETVNIDGGKESRMETVNIDGGKESRMETVNIDGGKESRMETVNINGEEYVRASDARRGFEESEHVIVVADRGWIFEGRMAEPYRLADAHVVRKWQNGLGIGGLQTLAYKDEYVLDDLPGGIEVAPSAVIAVLPIVEW